MVNISQLRTGEGRYNLGRKAGALALKVAMGQTPLGIVAQHAHSIADLKRQKVRRNNLPQSASNGAPVVENHRLISHRANVMLPRGADSRHRKQNRVEQARHHRANDKIIVDRALG